MKNGTNDWLICEEGSKTEFWWRGRIECFSDSVFKQLTNVESDSLVQFMEARQDTELIGRSHGVREEENLQESGVISNATRTVDTQQSEANLHVRNSDAKEFLAEIGTDQVERIIMEKERAVMNN